MSTLSWILLAAAIIIAAAYVLGRRSRGDPARDAARAPTSAAPATLPRPAASVPATARPRPAKTAARPALSAVASWGYQLQNLDIVRAAASPFDLLVVDTAKDGSDETALTSAELERLRRKPDGSSRIVLAYLSIGEAESYRSYWEKSWKRDKPAWLLGENPEWEENYSVCYWDPAWQGVMCGDRDARLDRILAAGFDGVYLDKCDVFEDLRRHFRREAKTRPDLEGDMIAFVAKISAYARARDPGFLVVMQNAETLLARADLRAVLDGVAKEELVFGNDGPEKRNLPEDIADSCRLLDRMRADGKPVFAVEYLANQSKIANAAETIRAAGYVVYIAPKDRDLKRLNYTILEA